MPGMPSLIRPSAASTSASASSTNSFDRVDVPRRFTRSSAFHSMIHPERKNRDGALPIPWARYHSDVEVALTYAIVVAAVNYGALPTPSGSGGPESHCARSPGPYGTPRDEAQHRRVGVASFENPMGPEGGAHGRRVP